MVYLSSAYIGKEGIIYDFFSSPVFRLIWFPSPSKGEQRGVVIVFFNYHYKLKSPLQSFFLLMLKQSYLCYRVLLQVGFPVLWTETDFVKIYQAHFVHFMLETLASAVFLKNSGSLSELGFCCCCCKFHLLSVCYTLTLVSLFFLPFIPPAQNLSCISSQVQASRLQLSDISPGVKASSLRDSRHARNFSFLPTNTSTIMLKRSVRAFLSCLVLHLRAKASSHSP